MPSTKYLSPKSTKKISISSFWKGCPSIDVQKHVLFGELQPIPIIKLFSLFFKNISSWKSPKAKNFSNRSKL